MLPRSSAIAGFGEENIVVRGFDVTAQSKQNGIQFGMARSDFKDMTKNILIQNNIIRGAGQDGIKISQGDNIQVLGNKIIGAGDQGIDFVAVNGSVISRNDISKVTGVAAVFAKGGSTNVRIEYNKIHDVKVDGITIGGWTTAMWMRPGMRRALEETSARLTNRSVLRRLWRKMAVPTASPHHARRDSCTHSV